MIIKQSRLGDRVIARLKARPGTFNMAEFSRRLRRGPSGTLFCLAGTILDESGVRLKYEKGRAIALAKGESQPAERWSAYESSINAVAVDPRKVAIPARARELWAAEYGDYAAESLAFYGADWRTDDLAQISADLIVSYLQLHIKGIESMHLAAVA